MKSYTSTSVSISKSQDAIRAILLKFGARSIQWSEDFQAGKINIRFSKEVSSTIRTVSVTMNVPLVEPINRKRTMRYVRGKMVYSKTLDQRKEQMTKATYRALHDWLKAQFNFVEFGGRSFEKVFLSDFEYVLPDGKVTTIGETITDTFNSPHLLNDVVDGIINE